MLILIEVIKVQYCYIKEKMKIFNLFIQTLLKAVFKQYY